MSPPGRGRRARYGKLRFPSCAPFHPPGPPLPFRSPPLVASCHVRLLGKASVSGTAPRAVPFFVEIRGADYTRSAERSVSGGRASGSSQRLRNCALGWASGRVAPGLLGEGEGSREKRRSRTLDRQETNARSSLTRQEASFSTRDNSPRSPARRDALGRRAREAVPDSRAAVSGAQGPKARKAPANKGGVIWWSIAK